MSLLDRFECVLVLFLIGLDLPGAGVATLAQIFLVLDQLVDEVLVAGDGSLVLTLLGVEPRLQLLLEPVAEVGRQFPLVIQRCGLYLNILPAAKWHGHTMGMVT